MGLYDYRNGIRVWVSNYLVLTGSIGLAILLIACFNFINLSIALSIRRNKEAGIKKVVGAKKRDIVIQFLLETFLVTIISMLVAIMIVELIRSGFNARFGDDIPLSLGNLSVLVCLTSIVIFTALVSGLVPVFYFASTNPILVLKGGYNTNNSFASFRKGLVIFQFVIPILMIILKLFVKGQDSYLKKMDIGFNKDRLFVVNNPPETDIHFGSIKSDLLTLPQMEAASFSNCVPTGRNTPFTTDVKWYSKNNQDKVNFWLINTDYDFSKVVNLKITGGRFFDPGFPSDSVNYVINDVAARIMNYPIPIGQQLTVEGKTGTIIGMFKDFYTVGLGMYVPTIIRINSGSRSNLLIRFSDESKEDMTGQLKLIYSRYASDNTYQVKSFREIYDNTELQGVSNLTGLASGIAILLACLGLFGLSSFNTVRRTKEIGVRKVNGACTIDIVLLLIQSYTRWIVVAFLIAAPIAFLVGNMWLRRFNNHISFPWWAFVAGFLAVYSIAILVVIGQTYRIARRNPVDALRYE